MNFVKFLVRSTVIALIGATLCYAEQLNIIAVTNPKFKGDTDQIMGIERILQKRAKDKKWKIHTVEVKSDDLSPILSLMEKNSKNVVISSNEYGIKALKDLKTRGKHFYGTVTSHQIFEDLEKAIKEEESGINLIALPGHVVTPAFKDSLKSSSVQLVETVGVAQNLLPADCDKSFQEKHDDIKGADKQHTKYMLVLLGGDTQNADGKTWSYCTVADMEKLAKYVAKIAKEKKLIVLVTNGPRTGKFDPVRGKETSGHRNGETDFVTAKFIETLQKEGLPETQYQLFDFQFNKPSDFNRLIGALRAYKGSQALIDGGSTSVVSQAIANLKGKAEIIVYGHSAMRDIHHLHIEKEYAAGRIALLKEDMTYLPIKKKMKTVKILPAEEAIADAILRSISIKK